MILINPDFAQLNQFAGLRELRAVVHGEHIALADADRYLHYQLERELGSRFGFGGIDNMVELYIDRRGGDVEVRTLYGKPSTFVPKVEETLNDLRTVLGGH